MVQKEIPEEITEYGDSNERLPREKREERLNKRLQDIVAYAYKNAPAMKDRFDNAGVSPSDIRTIKDLEKLPVMTKDHLVKLQRANPPFGGCLTVPLNTLNRIYISPGPIYDAWNPKRVTTLARKLYWELGG